MHEKAKYVKCSEEQEKKIQTVRDALSLVYKLFDDILPDSREASLSYDRLEEAQFWAIKSISHTKEK